MAARGQEGFAVRGGADGGAAGKGYDAFISFSHSADSRLAPTLQHCLHRLAKPWYRPRALRVFRDQSSLSVNPDLWADIETALGQARYFILMASPAAARSVWVQQEVAFWMREHGPETFLIALTDGTISWDRAAQDFDWQRTTALPPALRGWFRAEPLWVALGWAHRETQLSLRHSRFRDVVATLAATIHGVAKDDLDSEDVRQHRVMIRLRRSAVTVLTLLTLATAVLGVTAEQQRQTAVAERRVAQAQARIAVSRAVASEAQTLADADPRQATRLALTAYAVDPTGEAKRALMTLVDRNRHTAAYVRPGIQEVTRTLPGSGRIIREVSLSPDGGTLAYGAAEDTGITLWDTRADRVSAILKLPSGRNVLALRFIPGTGRLLSYDGRQILVWDTRSHQIERAIDYTSAYYDPPEFSVSPDGRTLACHEGGAHTQDPRLSVWDLTTGRRVTVRTHDTTPAMAFTPDGAHLLDTVDADPDRVDATDGTVSTRLEQLDLRTGTWTALPVRVSWAMPIAMAARAPRLAVARGREVELWDYAHLRRLAIGASPYGAEILSLAVSADGNTVVAGDEDGHVIGFDSTMKRPERLTQHRDSVMAVDVSADGRLAASTSIDQSVMLTTPHSDLRSRPLTPPPAGEAPLQPSLAVSPDGRSLAVSAREGVQVWKLPTATTQGAPVGHPDPRTIEPGVGWSPDGRLLAAATQGVLSVWDARSHAEAGSFTHAFPQAPQFDGTEEARFMPDGRSVLINLPDGPAVVDYARHIVRQQLTAEDPGSGFAASADGRVMVMAEHARADGTVLSIWHWEGGTLHRVGRLTDTAMLRDLAVSQDGTEIAMADFDGRVVVHGLRDGRRTVLVSGLGDSHSSVAFSPDGSTVVQYESEHQLAVWDDTSGLLLGTWDYPDAGAAANNLAFGPDGSLLTIGADGAVMRWAVDATRWRAALCGMALTDLTNAEKDRYLQGTGITVHAMCPR